MKPMTPSAEEKTTTTGQIDKAVGQYRAMLEKYAKQFNSDAVQTALGQPELTYEMFAVFRRRVEAVSNLIVRHATVNRSRTPQEALDATGRMHYGDRTVVDIMPKGEGDEVEVVFFKLNLSDRNGYILDDELEMEFELRGLIPADPYSLAAINEADPAFADKLPHATHWKDAKGMWCYVTFNADKLPHATHWKDAKGMWCYVTFNHFDNVRRVAVERSDIGWPEYWWFAGLRK